MGPSLVLSSTGQARSAGAAGGVLALTGGAVPVGLVGAAGGLTLDGLDTARAVGVAVGLLTLAGLAQLPGPAASTASGGLTLAGTTGGKAPTAITGGLTLSTLVDAQAVFAAAGQLLLTGTTGPSLGGTAQGWLTLSSLVIVGARRHLGGAGGTAAMGWPGSMVAVRAHTATAARPVPTAGAAGVNGWKVATPSA